MVSDIPGTTRDAIDTTFHRCGRHPLQHHRYRRHAQEKGAWRMKALERYSVLRSIAAIDRCDVALLLIDAQTGVTEQDTKIAGLILNAGKAVHCGASTSGTPSKRTPTPWKPVPQEDP